jgi:hypothetical protein
MTSARSANGAAGLETSALSVSRDRRSGNAAEHSMMVSMDRAVAQLVRERAGALTKVIE